MYMNKLFGPRQDCSLILTRSLIRVCTVYQSIYKVYILHYQMWISLSSKLEESVSVIDDMSKYLQHIYNKLCNNYKPTVKMHKIRTPEKLP